MKIKLIINNKEKIFNNWLELKTWFYEYLEPIDQYNIILDGQKLSVLSSLVFTTTGELPERKEKRRRFF